MEEPDNTLQAPCDAAQKTCKGLSGPSVAQVSSKRGSGWLGLTSLSPSNVRQTRTLPRLGLTCYNLRASGTLTNAF